MKKERLLVRVDLYGEGDVNDMWDGKIYGLSYDDFLELRDDYEHDGSNSIHVTWEEYLEKNKVVFEHLNFDYDDY